jgi:hypothetical protein
LPGHTVAIESVTIKGGGGGNGACILNELSTLNLKNCTVSGNLAVVDDGGAIYNDGSAGSATLTVIDCLITGNHARYRGGGIFNNGNVSMWNTRVTGNSVESYSFPFSGGDGGGIYNGGAGARMTLTNCVVSGNTSGGNVLQPGGSGGGISNNGGDADDYR